MRQRKVIGNGQAVESTAFPFAQIEHTQASRCRSLTPSGKFLSVILVILFYTAAVSSACQETHITCCLAPFA